MKLDLADINAVVKENRLPEVRNPILLNAADQPTPDGLFSYDLFGLPSDRKRRFQFGYIDLKRKYLHPMVYSMIFKLFRGLPHLISRTKNFSIGKDGRIKTDPDGNTGLDWFIANRGRLKWGEKGVKARDRRIDLLEGLSDNEVFVDKWLVCPPFYRDVSRGSGRGKLSVEALTELYQKLLHQTSGYAGGDGYTGGRTEWRIQETLNESYTMLLDRLAKKRGLIRKNLVGRYTDYAVGAVISGPSVSSERHTEMQIPYGMIGVPLHLAMTMFFPFVIKALTEFLADFRSDRLVVTGRGSDRKDYNLVDETIEGLTSTRLEKLVKLYSHAIENRLNKVGVLTESGEESLEYGRLLGRGFTLTDLLYIVTFSATQNKHVLATRYPLEDYRNISPFKMRILTTEETEEKVLESQTYAHYPKLDLKNPDRIQVGGLRAPEQRLPAGIRRGLRWGYFYLEGLVHARGERRDGGFDREAHHAAGPRRPAFQGILQGGYAGHARFDEIGVYVMDLHCLHWTDRSPSLLRDFYVLGSYLQTAMCLPGMTSAGMDDVVFHLGNRWNCFLRIDGLDGSSVVLPHNSVLGVMNHDS